MKIPSEREAAPEIAQIVAELLGTPATAVKIQEASPKLGFDFRISVSKFRFAVEYTASPSVGPVSMAVSQLARCREKSVGKETPLVAVPFMGQVGRDVCAREGVSWLDLSGNAKITAPGLRIWIEGRPNKFSGPGRPPSVFAPKSSRVIRQLLLHPEGYQSQAELAHRAKLDDGYVSKIVRRLHNESFVQTNDEGRIRPRNANLLLDAWQSEYDFSRHHIVKGHVAARSGDELLQRLARPLSQQDVQYAATALGASWLFTHFATFRMATFYFRTMPGRSLLKAIEFWEEPKGANVQLVVPNDEGVFQGSQIVEGIPCVSPVQVYLDLKNQTERAKEAADELRKQLLHFDVHG